MRDALFVMLWGWWRLLVGIALIAGGAHLTFGREAAGLVLVCAGVFVVVFVPSRPEPPKPGGRRGTE